MAQKKSVLDFQKMKTEGKKATWLTAYDYPTAQFEERAGIDMILVGDKISILTGIDSQFYPSLCAGSKGIFSTAACVVPQQMVDLFNAFEKGNHKAASTIHTKPQDLNRFFEYDPGYVAPCKESLIMLGLPVGPVRAPLPHLTEQQRAQIRQALLHLGLLNN